MAQIREIKKRIKSVTNTQKVTHAMELVAAAKMRKAQTLALAGRPYATTLHEILASVRKASQEEHVHPLLKTNEAAKELVIIVSSDRGLAGGLNLNIFREILRTLGDQDIRRSGHQGKNNLTTQKPNPLRQRSEASNPKTYFITVGKKARDFVSKTGNELVASWGSEEIPPLNLARLLTKMATEAFIDSEFSLVSMIYPHFESTVKQNPRWVQLLPISQPAEMEEKYEDQEFIYEPQAGTILESILTHHILTQIYQVLLEAKASEHSARMVAMKNATDAAEDLVSDLTLTYNQARQEAITTELLDIVTAQKAFE